MIHEHPRHHRAHYDAQGDIILPGVEHPPVSPEEALVEIHFDSGVSRAGDVPFTVVEDDWATELACQADQTGSPGELWLEMRGRMHTLAETTLDEGRRQLSAGIRESERFRRQLTTETGSGLRRLLAFLRQPVWVPGRRSTPKRHSRGMLFLLDTLRFGGTFGMLFLLLFSALNYQSFWEIVRSRIDPLTTVSTVDSPSFTERRLAEKLKDIPSLTVAGNDGFDVLDLLPPVGPPENRLIIPRLNLNVPIVLPPTDALLREDWKKLEEDIQTALQSGVAHYPGTSKPGQAGNFFLTGHSSYFPWAPGEFKWVFARLAELQVGDEYWVFYGGDRHRYIIQNKKEIRPSDVSVLDQPLNKRISTLMTCTPVGTTLRRLIITAQEVDPVTGEALAVGERETRPAHPTVRTDMLPI